MDDFEMEPVEVQRRLAASEVTLVVDVREDDEREAGYIPGSDHVALARLADPGAIDTSRPVVFYCRVGGRSAVAAQAFRAAGAEAYSMVGGLLRWEAEGRALEPEGGHVATH